MRVRVGDGERFKRQLAEMSPEIECRKKGKQEGGSVNVRQNQAEGKKLEQTLP